MFILLSELVWYHVFCWLLLAARKSFRSVAVAQVLQPVIVHGHYGDGCDLELTFISDLLNRPVEQTRRFMVSLNQATRPLIDFE